MNCSQCRRCNPATAHFCWFDGAPLNGQANRGLIDVGRQPFSSPFRFPSGRDCRNFEELALACQEEWASAADILRRGVLAGFLAQIGRADLAAVARESARLPDADRGLDHFLARLPSQALPAPRLRVEPASVNLGALQVGKDHVFRLHLKNDGKRLLYGWIAMQGGWLRIGDGIGAQAKMFQFGTEQSVPVHIKGKMLRAGKAPLEGKLIVESNGGTSTIPITASVPVKPFTEGVLAGATSPRELADKARLHPQAAAPLFENGAVTRWYHINGWKYPVAAPQAIGLGAVQQYFEALGLVQPPQVHLTEERVVLKARPGEAAQHTLTLQGSENLLVWAHAVSDQAWLEVGRPSSSGRNALIPLTVHSAPHLSATSLTAHLTVTTNGNKQFRVPVQLEVLGASPTHRVQPIQATRPLVAQPATIATVAEAREPVVVHAPSRRKWAYALAALFLILGFGTAVVHDLLLKPDEESSFAVAPLIHTQPRIALHFHDADVNVKLGQGGIKPAEGEVDMNHTPAVWEPSMRFGLTMLGQADTTRPGADKRLTYSNSGLTNNTCILLDGNQWLFGESPFRLQDGKREGTSAGHWLEMKADLGTNPVTGLKSEGWSSVWIYDAQKVTVTQTVEVVPGDQSRLLDTCLVRYRIDNKDDQPHRVGLRFLLDTYIGANDGVPFTLPGSSSLCDTEIQFNQAEDVPDFIEALERPDLRDPGTVAHLGLKRGGGYDAPDRLTLGAWPNFRLYPRNNLCLQEKTLWQVPVLPIKTLTPADSAVTIYWNEKPLAPGGHRELAFTYGLGNVASGEAAGKLGVSVGGSFVAEGEFTVTAYVSKPSPDERVSLTLPDGFELLSGAAEQGVPPLPAGAVSSNSPVTWKVRAAARPGRYTLKVRASSGVVQSQPIIIRSRGGIFN